jgi:putative transposase
MKKSRFTETQILGILKEYEAGMPSSEIARKYAISKFTLYTWKSKYAGMVASDMKRLKELEEENAKLKKMYANLSLENHALKDLIEKKL